MKKLIMLFVLLTALFSCSSNPEEEELKCDARTVTQIIAKVYDSIDGRTYRKTVFLDVREEPIPCSITSGKTITQIEYLNYGICEKSVTVTFK